MIKVKKPNFLKLPLAIHLVVSTKAPTLTAFYLKNKMLHNIQYELSSNTRGADRPGKS